MSFEDIFETFLQDKMNPTFIFVDGSYFCFHRYYALNLWWKNAFKETPLEDPFQNEIFVDKFKKTFVENIQNISKKLKLDKKVNPILIAGKDCKRENIWRNELYPQYKATRNNNQEDGFKGGPFFKMAYDEKLFEKGGIKAILSHPHLEADDCIALSVKYLKNKYPGCVIYIITSDRDYLQLQSENIHIYNLAYKNISENKSSTGNALNDLKIKILSGDISDNIQSVFPNCGIKTAQKCIDDPEYFASKMKNNPEYLKQYELNEKLVNFDFIPEKLVNEFIESIRVNNKANQ
jgi:5'-3' exonuclease